LRYTIPFSVPEKTIEIFHQVAEKGKEGETPAIVMADDGENSALARNYKSVYQEKWLERF